MELNNKLNNNLFDDEDDDILLNPILYINQYESNNNIINDIDKNVVQYENEKILEAPPKKNHNSPNSTFNTNAALDECSNEINYNISFSFNRNQQNENEQKKEMTQKSINILSELIEKENKLIENKNNINEKEDKKAIILKINDLKSNFEKLELTLKFFFKSPFMRKNYMFTKKFENKCDEKKISLSDEIDIKIDDTKKAYIKNKVNVNNIIINNNINEI